MTKIKNTKKGMAKKTLSVSLAVAMLATSNVPVWAAEFSDGVDVAAFTAEAPVEVEAPVMEDTTETPVAEATVTDDSYGVTAVVSGVENGSVVWEDADGLSASFKMTKKEETSIPDGIQFYYAWKINGLSSASNSEYEIDRDDVYDSIYDGDIIQTESPVLVGADAGATLTLCVYARDLNANGKVVWQYTSDGIQIKAVDLTAKMNTNISIKDSWDPEYDGKDHIITKDDLQFTDFDASKFDISVSGDTKNVTDDGVTVTITRNDAGYTGEKKLKYSIAPLTLDGTTGHLISEHFVATLKTTNFVYTGKVIKVKASDITLVDKDTNTDLSNYLQADEEGYVSLNNIDPQDAGEYEFRLNLINGQPETGCKNYEIAEIEGTPIASDPDGYRTVKTSNKATIAVRDLSTVNVSIKAKAIPATGTSVTLSKEDVTFTDKNSNEELELFGGVDITIPKEATTKGSYDVVIEPKTGNDNISGKTTAKLNLVAADISPATFTGNGVTTAEEYTGTAITKTEKQLGSLMLDGKPVDKSQYSIVYENNTNAGTAKLIVKGKGSFEGSEAVFTFTINPAKVTAADIKAEEKVEFIDTQNPADYKNSMNIVVKAKNANNKEFTLENGVDYVVKYSFDEANVIDVGQVKADITITNKNFIKDNNKTFSKSATIKARAIKSENIKLKQSSFTYTGKAVTPAFDVVIDGKVINPNLYTYEFTNNINAGTATLTVKGTDKPDSNAVDKNTKYSDIEAKITFEIKPADASKLEGVIASEQYRGYSIEIPADGINLKLGNNTIDVASNFKLSYGENINIGDGTVTLTPKNNNFTGTKTLTFKIVGQLLNGKGTFKYYDTNGIEIEDPDGYFTYDGSAHTFGKVIFNYGGTEKLVEGTDYELVYVDNVYGKGYSRTAAVLAVAKGTYGSNVTDADMGLINGIYTDAEGNKTANVIAAGLFDINPVRVSRNNITVKNAVYAGGLPVKPEVSIIVKGVTLVEGRDYDLYVYGDDLVNATTSQCNWVEVVFKNGYFAYGYYREFPWGIDKFDLANADVAVEDGKVVVKCGKVDVESSEYTTTVNAEDGTTTITAVATSKNYTGSKTFSTNGKTDAEKPETPMLVNVNVVGNTATAVLSDECDGATGYDFVIGTSRDCITTKDYVKVNKNVLRTETPFTYVQQGTYYAYCHAWKRVNGVKVFSDWSNAYPFVVTAITPDQPVITSVKANGSTVTVTYTQAANATGYDVVLGSEVKKVNGESRPVNYGELVEKNIKGNTVTATFKNVPAGTYYAGLHAFNRTSEDGKKVFSPWSNTKKVTVK